VNHEGLRACRVVLDDVPLAVGERRPDERHQRRRRALDECRERQERCTEGEHRKGYAQEEGDDDCRSAR
jgi:hypothetical protein